jgi:V/A-type H+-transporting ATPase subunit I
MLRAHATLWFEIVTTHEDFARVMQELARSGAAQLEAKPLDGAQPVLPKLGPFFEEYGEMQKRYGAIWPPANPDAHASLENPEAVLDNTIETLQNWAQQADPLIATQQALTTTRSDLKMIEMLVSNSGSGFPIPPSSEAENNLLSHTVYFIFDSDSFEPTTEGVISVNIPAPNGVFVIAIAEPDVMTSFVTEMKARKAVFVPIPDFLGSDPEQHAQQVGDQLVQNAASLQAVSDELAALADEFHLGDVLARITVLKWLYDNRGEVQATTRTTRITGWTTSTGSGTIREKLDEAGVNYVISVAPTADRDNAPMVLQNPFWLKAFEFFPRMLGVPARGEADPSIVTALIATVMFGYMFGDVGQGAVLIGVGLLMKKSVPLLTLLIPGGIAAMIFGVLFGSVFSRDDILTPLWLHPLDEPITVLLVAVLMGVGFLFVGIALDLLQALWQRKGIKWVRSNGGIVLTYVSLLLAYWQPLVLWGLPAGVVWSLVGARDADNKFTPMAAAVALGEHLETLMRLLVSSVSFSRVGAFALAHAGLSTAIVGIAETAGSVGFWIVLLFGNALIIGLEGLVTGIQTTRLVLFEFFTRFFHAGGREFHPLSFPNNNSSLNEGNTS